MPSETEQQRAFRIADEYRAVVHMHLTNGNAERYALANLRSRQWRRHAIGLTPLAA